MTRLWSRVVPARVAFLVAVGFGMPTGVTSQVDSSADDLLRGGDYEAAIDRLEEANTADSGPDSAARLAEVLLEIGRADRAADHLVTALDRHPERGDLSLLLGHALILTGHLDEAQEFLASAARGTGEYALLAELARGELILRRGDREEALRIFDRFIDVYNRSSGMSSRELMAVAGAVRHLGVTDPSHYHDALRAYDEAIAEDSTNLQAHIEVGALFLEKYNISDARQAFRQVLDRRARHPGALLGLARSAELEGDADALELVNQALEVNADLVPALVMRARIHMSAEDFEEAEADLQRALDVNPTSGEALAVLAAARLVQRDAPGYVELRDRALALNPHDAEFFAVAAELASRNRLYHDAVELAGQGVAIDSLSWHAHGVKGLNQLRIGDIEGGRRNLEASFAGDPFNIWIVNTLDLLDTMDGFQEWDSGRVRVLVDPDDGEVLATYMLEVADQAYRSLAERYGHEPTPPVRVEAFRRSVDFSVRTMGLTGLGALGVSFGPVVAMDSPSARGSQGFLWASTLWHEMAHTVHLEMTDHRVPRWFSEGLSVREEKLAGEGWGMRPSLAFFTAYLEGRLRAPSDLSRSFTRPRFPDEVGFAYILGSLVTEWIEEEWGLEALLGMMSGYRDGLSQDEVVRRTMNLEMLEFDEGFDVWLRERHSGGLSAAAALDVVRSDSDSARTDDPDWLEERIAATPTDVWYRLALGRVLLEAERPDEAITPLVEARDIFPENPAPLGPNRLLAQAYGAIGDDVATASALQDHLSNVGGDYAAHLELAELLEGLGDVAGAANALEGAIHIQPFDRSVHTRLAELYRDSGDGEKEVRERRVLLAMNPADRAGAFYELADAQFRAGRIDEARDTVLRALEIAPRFPEAQDLLLRTLGPS